MKNIKKSSGQALVLLLVFASIAITITSAAVIMIAVNSATTTKADIGNTTLDVAESGTENALLRLLRDPNYGGETIRDLPVTGGVIDITVSPGNFPKTITSIGTYNNFKRTIQVAVGYNNNQYTVNSWKEITP